MMPKYIASIIGAYLFYYTIVLILRINTQWYELKTVKFPAYQHALFTSDGPKKEIGE